MLCGCVTNPQNMRKNIQNAPLILVQCDNPGRRRGD
jgi:hypothetical protein